MNIYQKLVEVRKSVPYLQKQNEGAQYKYVSSSQTLGAIRKKMDELNLLLIPEILESRVNSVIEEGKDKFGNDKKRVTYFTELDIKYVWVNADKPDETIEKTWYGQGVDIAGEKGVGKALTYAEKYFILKSFNVPTDKDDPDNFQDNIENKGNGKTEPAKTTATTKSTAKTTTAKTGSADIKGDDPEAELKRELIKKYQGSKKAPTQQDIENAKAEFKKIRSAQKLIADMEAAEKVKAEKVSPENDLTEEEKAAIEAALDKEMENVSV